MERMSEDAETQLQAWEQSAGAPQASQSDNQPAELETNIDPDGRLSLLPPNADPGKCYARIWIPPQYETRQERIVTREADESLQIKPARFETAEMSVLIEEASERIEVIPATYKWVEEEVMVKPQSKELVEVPAKYGEVTENILVKPAHRIWKKGRGPIQKFNDATGEIMCLVEVPAVYKTVSRRVVTSPATVNEITVPAEYMTVRRQVLDRPASTQSVTIPAKHKTISVAKQVEHEKAIKTPIPVEYGYVEKRELVADGHMEWREILCETNMTKATITSIQRSLLNAGYDPGPVDGVVGYETMKAVNAFRQDGDLPISEYLDLESVELLGVELIHLSSL
jgi:hypothetical protein